MNGTDASYLVWSVLFTCAVAAGCGSAPVEPPATRHSTRPGFLAPRAVAPLFDPKLSDKLLDEPGRDKWQQPARIVRALRLRQGDVVADVGSGSGYLLPYLSRAVGPRGIVYAQEIQKGFLPALRRHARKLGNVRVVLGTTTDPRLPRRKTGTFVLLTVYHEVDKPLDFLRALHAAAKPDARLAIIDFDGNRRGNPPPPIGHEIGEKTVLREAKAAGWVLHERHEFIPSQFFLVFRRQATGA